MGFFRDIIIEDENSTTSLIFLKDAYVLYKIRQTEFSPEEIRTGVDYNYFYQKIYDLYGIEPHKLIGGYSNLNGCKEEKKKYRKLGWSGIKINYKALSKHINNEK